MVGFVSVRVVALTVTVAALTACLPVSQFERVSLDGTDAQVTEDSSGASVSDDGRYVVFSSKAPQYVGSTSNLQVFRKDRTTGDVLLVSAASTGGVSNGQNLRAVISGGGRWIAWDSTATNIRPALDARGGADVWRQEVDEAGLVGDPVLVSAGPGGTSGTGSSTGPSITTDGAFIAFRSDDHSMTSFDALVDDGVFVWEEGSPLDYASDGLTVRWTVSPSRSSRTRAHRRQVCCGMRPGLKLPRPTLATAEWRCSSTPATSRGVP